MYNPLFARVYRGGAPFTRFSVLEGILISLAIYLSMLSILAIYLLSILFIHLYIYIYHCVISLFFIKARVGRCALVFHTFSHFHSNSLNDHLYPLFPLIYIFVNTWMFSGMSLIFGEVWRVEDVLVFRKSTFFIINSCAFRFFFWLRSGRGHF